MRLPFIILMLSASLSSAAQNVSGLYAGTLYNDSTKMIQKYELALSEYRGKITGYSYTTFVVNDTFYYGIRRVKAVRLGDQLIVEDVAMLANNFPEAPAKRVRRTTTIPLNGQDSIINLTGRWRTTQTKEYYAVPGSVDLRRDNDSNQSSLISHLRELNIIGGYSQSGPPLAEAKKNNTDTKRNIRKETTTLNGTETAKVTKRGSDGEKVIKDVTPPVDTKKASGDIAVKETKSSGGVSSTRQKQTAVVVEPVVLTYDQRKTKVLQAMSVQSDSLVLTFYDNGVVDGDVISVYVNGNNIVKDERLTEAAVKRVVKFSQDKSDSVELTLVAETLGSLPPNTGLLVVTDGANKYQVRFSADLQTNASIIFRKEKK